MGMGGLGCLVLVMVLISQVGFIIGEEGGGGVVEKDPAAMGDELDLEEVSIEAVDDYEPHLPRYISSRGGSSGESESVLDTPVVAELPSDNSTAVATVYPEIAGSLSAGNASVTNGTATNATATPSRYLRVKVSCSELLPEGDGTVVDESGRVEIVNITHLLHGILITNPTIKTRSTPSNCTVIMFFTHWCPWSAKAAPHFNALPRAFKNIRFAAIDSSVYTAVNTYFGILSVPSVVLFYNGKILAKFNETNFSVNQFAEFISTFTDQKPGIRLNVTSNDFIGPLPSVITKGHDWYLYMSWTFMIGCLVYYMSRTLLWARILEIFQNSWREAEAVNHHHFHED